MDSIELQGLTKSFNSPQAPVRAVRAIDVSIGRGETVALLGPNGAGKSTTIDMLLGLTEPDGGKVSLFGTQPAAAVDAGAIGAMLQTGALIRDLSVRELVTVMASLYPNPLGVDEVIELTGITEFAGRHTHKLSGGETQRARFAIALVSNAELLVLDEPAIAMAAFGTMSAMLSSGARIAGERAVGWNRQLRITPLTTRNYFRAKVLTGYALALTSLLLLYTAGATLGVSMAASDWVEMTLLILVGLVPFAAAGILLGHLLTVDSIGPVIGGLTALLSILGGAWFPIASSGTMHDIAQLVPSYWLSGRAYRRDTKRA